MATTAMTPGPFAPTRVSVELATTPSDETLVDWYVGKSKAPTISTPLHINAPPSAIERARPKCPLWIGNRSIPA